MATATLTQTKPPKVWGPTTKTLTRPTKQIPKDIINAAAVQEVVKFDAEKHLNFQPPARRYTMSEIGLGGQGISPIAASEPFSLYTEEATRQIRSEIFSEPVLRDCQYASSFCQNMIRGMGPKRAPFIYSMWNSPELLAKVSEVAGIDLVPAFDYETAHINISIGDKSADVTVTDSRKNDEGDNAAFAWHYDSFPFVCVTMLSDCTNMVGGETAMKMPSGEVMKVRGPSMGTAVVMQGRYIEHQALKAFGGSERITMTTPFRPRDPMARDESVLTTVRGISHLGELYASYSEYRMKLMQERMEVKMKSIQEKLEADGGFDVDAMHTFLKEQQDYLQSMIDEIRHVGQ